MNKKNLPTYHLLDFCKASISVWNLVNGSLYQKHVQLKDFDIYTPHYSDYYVFNYIHEGEYAVMVDLEKVTIKGPAFFFILPRQIKCVLTEFSARGWAFAIESSLVEKRLGHIFEKEIFNAGPIAAPESTASYLSTCMQILENMTNAREASLNIQKNLASSCIEMIANTYLANGIEKQRSENRQIKYTQDFFFLLNEKYLEQKTPSQYAKDLNITTPYLNECVKSSTGKPVSYWIQHELMLEAKRMLYYTELSIKEIGFELGFEDQSHFSRFFSKHAQISPKVFRNRLSLRD